MELNTIAAVVQLMASATSPEDWDEKVNQVKAFYGGKYPAFWGRMIMESGIAAETWGKWTYEPPPGFDKHGFPYGV